MKQEVQFLINALFWEKYIDVIDENNYRELTGDFYKYISEKIPSAEINIWKDHLPALNTVIFIVSELTIKIKS